MCLDAYILDMTLQKRADAWNVPESAPPHGVLLFDAGAPHQSVSGEPVEVCPADAKNPTDLGVSGEFGARVDRIGGVDV